ncbi:MAG: phytanoyl-CoA dioxygenase [Candidatus Marinimicrobia bacterium]|nr:phytanoyl-CoA dioxygenase [Candidatus Neomarinimicrobiota bacterium]|tara:strand:- start:4513 stop:5319 length:807 start_codon:yes stop_codon:yes gene_type:complete
MSVIKTYKKNGYHVAKNLLPKILVNQVLYEINELINKQLVSLGIDVGQTLGDSLKLLFEKDIGRYKKVLSSLWRSLELTRLLQNQIIIDYVKENFGFENILLPGGQVIHIQSKSLIIPGGYFGFDPHQDYQSVRGSLDGLIVWIPFNDIDKNNYPLELIPGSHLNGLYPLKTARNEQAVIDPASYSEKDFLSIILGKGDVVFMSYFTLHRSSRKGLEENVRIACSTRFDNCNEKSFIKRGYPTAYIRDVDRNVNNIFPSRDDIIKIFS